jgi:thioredoxin-related protein
MRQTVAEYRTGERLPLNASIDVSKSAQTLLLFLRSTCKFCTESMPFYVRLAAARRTAGTDLRLVVISADPPQVLAAYLAEFQLRVDQAVTLAPAELAQFRVRGTPTLVLTDRSGTVRRVWIGKLQQPAESELLASITAVPSVRGDPEP